MPKFIDHSGKYFESWRIVKRAGRIGTYALWERECICGKKDETASKNLFRGAKDCGCSISLIGKKFGKLIVLEKLNNELCNSFSNFKVICECGKDKIVKGKSLTSKNISSCGCARRKTISSMGLKTIYNSYKKRAIKKEILFDLNLNDFEYLIKSNCYYCDCTPNQKYKFIEVEKNKDRCFMYNGIDRIDSETGYIKFNCVSCCKTCNFMKLSMNKKEWFDHMIKILKFNKVI